jgi:TolB-like protein
MSGDSEQEYFSDGITEEFIIDLSKVSTLNVLSRNATFTFKGEAADVGRDSTLESRREPAGQNVHEAAEVAPDVTRRCPAA